MPTPAQRALRARSITLSVKTADMVVPRAVSLLIDEGKLTKASRLLDRCEADWPNDPEITRYRSLIAFLSPSHAQR